jgi:hypothetical protein
MFALQEPEYFSYDCDYDPLGCPPATQKEYIEEVGGCGGGSSGCCASPAAASVICQTCLS